MSVEAAEMAEEGKPPALICEPTLRGRTLPTTSAAEDVAAVAAAKGAVAVEACAAELASASAAKAAAKAAAAAAA